MPSIHRYEIPTIILSILIAGVALFLWVGRDKPVEVTVETVGFGTVQDTVTNTRAGTIKACRRAGISPSIGGQIDKLSVKEGDEVKAGQLLVELWHEDQNAELELATSEARAAEATARQSCIKAEVASREADRQNRLMKDRLTSEEAVDKADGEARALRAACNAAHAKSEVSQARIHVVQAALDKTRLTAPFEGIVAEVNGEVGEFVTPSPVGIPTPPTVDLVDVSCLYVSAPIDEVDAPRIRVGMKAGISLDAMADQVFEGRVRRIAPYVLEVEKQARTVEVEVDFLCREDCRHMLPGYSADVEVVLDEAGRALRIPTEAIMEGNRVLVLTDDGLLEEREIGVGLSNWEWTQVSAGLDEGQEVVVSVEREGVEDGAHAVREAQVDD
ncbi:MAG: efflux RND transporter periplasmic adaptor subunit [Gammaproteobacteria bacterium]|jgi:HlyD family secretion protein|nr:efflux RND transporter periplasmic adaptor subunit [Gammaproteobacteria bacterium]